MKVNTEYGKIFNKHSEKLSNIQEVIIFFFITVTSNLNQLLNIYALTFTKSALPKQEKSDKTSNPKVE